MRLSAISTSAILFVASAGAVSAQPAAPAAAHDPANCYCRSAAGRAPVGARQCLATPQGWRVAVCAMDQNVTSWSPTPENCAPVSYRRGLAPEG